MDDNKYHTEIRDISTGTFCTNVSTTRDGLVRIAILPPATGKVGPMWVAYGRKDAFWWALKVIRAALFGSFRETTHKE